jgi:hypothetical protein
MTAESSGEPPLESEVPVPPSASADAPPPVPADNPPSSASSDGISSTSPSAPASPPPPPPPPIYVDGHRLENDVCRYHERGTDRWLPSSGVRWSDVRRFWHSLHGADKGPRQKIVRAPPPPVAPKRPKITPARDEGPIEIIGLIPDRSAFQLAVRHPGSTDVVTMQTSEARARYPIQLSQFYESHIEFS